MILSLPIERPYNARYKREKNDYKTILHTTIWQPIKKSREDFLIPRKISIDTKRKRHFIQIIEETVKVKVLWEYDEDYLPKSNSKQHIKQ